MLVTTDDIIDVGQKNIKDFIQFTENSRFTINPLVSSNRGVCMSIPVRCYPEQSKVFIVIPLFLSIDMLEGKLTASFDKYSSTVYNYDSLGCPMILKDDIFVNNRFDRERFNCCIEELVINEDLVKSIPEFENVKLVSNIVTCGSKPKYNSGKASIPMYIGTQLTFPNGGKDSKLFYLVNDTFAIGTKSKWIVSNTFDNFKGSMHVYVTVVTSRDTNSVDYMRKNYIYIQVKRKFASCIGDLIVCNGKLYAITVNDLKAGGEVEINGNTI